MSRFTAPMAPPYGGRLLAYTSDTQLALSMHVMSTVTFLHLWTSPHQQRGVALSLHDGADHTYRGA